MAAFSDRVRAGEWTGRHRQAHPAVVNIGIGGSDLGPAMAYEALGTTATARPHVRFVSNVDPVDL